MPVHVVHAEDDFPSFEALDKRHFPVSELDAPKVLPRVVTEKSLLSPLGDNVDEQQPILVVQLNFIRGGLVLGVAVHHSCSDGPGVDGFLTTWAEGAAAVAAGQPFPAPIDPANLDRSRLSPASAEANQPGWEQLDGKFPIFKDMKGPLPPPPADFQMPVVGGTVWHFPASSLTQLKADASPAKLGQAGAGAGDQGLGDAWVSTYDAVVAFLWQRVTVARLPHLRPDLATAESVLAHAVNTRNKTVPPLPDRFLGNAVAIPRTDPVPVRVVVQAGSLPRLAALVRRSTRSITPRYLDELGRWVAGLRDRRWVQIHAHAFLGMDFLASSWQPMRAYVAHDFGFGLPRALRWPNPSWDGYVFLFPSRAHLVGGDEGLEVCLCLEKKTADGLMADEVMLKYASPRV